MPIITSEDSKNLAQLEEQMSALLNKVASDEKSDYKVILNLAESVQKSLTTKERFLRLKRDISKQMETLAREENANLTQEETDTFKELINEEADLVERTRGFINALKDLEAQSRSFLARKKEYADSIKTVAGVRNNMVALSTRLETDKNKMIPADNLQRMEDALTDKTRDFGRVKADRDKKFEQLKNDVLEMNKLWIAVKKSIDEFTW
ncbi:MAG TPA: hypothetical protein VKK79_19825 [Candidatus Lokiarchaeia archaeon]|nr:hypothetical protein [Candidatus Lokiarchaeia archaeon]